MDPVLSTLAIVSILALALTIHIGAGVGLAVLAAIVVGDLPIALFTQKLYSTFENFPLLALPFFICAGDIMQRGTMAPALLKLSKTLVGHITGGLSQVAVLGCGFYGSLCGSPPATVAAIGGILIPAMKKEGYPASFSAAVNTASGTLGALIPPSTLLIMYGGTAGVSIGDLFIAIIGPGILTIFVFMGLAWFISRRKGYGLKSPRASWKDRVSAIWEAKWALLVPVIVLGGIYSGITTPTEAGVVAVVYALFAETFLTRTMTWKKLLEILTSTPRTTGMIFYVVTSATAMGVLLVYFNVDQVVVELISGISSSPMIITFMVATLIIIMGTFMEPGPIVLIMTPILLPLMVSIGCSPLQFGIIMGYGTTLGNITPPVGMNLYVGCSISDVSFAALSRAIMPFMFAQIAVFYLVTFCPAISLFLL